MNIAVSRGKDYNTLTPDKEETIKADSKERQLAYLLITNSSSTTAHDMVRKILLEAFIAKQDKYPASRYDAIALHNKNDERKMPQINVSEGTMLTQKGEKKSGDTSGTPQKPLRTYYC